MTHATVPKKFIVTFFLILFAMSAAGLWASIASAAGMDLFSKQLTNPADVIAGGVEGKVDLHLKNVEGIAVVNTNKMAVYYPLSVADNKDEDAPKLSANGQMQLKITKGRDGGACRIPNNATGNIQVRVLDKVIWQKPVKNACTDFIGATIKFADVNKDFEVDGGLFKASIIVEFTGAAMPPSALGGNTDGYSLNYNMEFSDSKASHENKGKLALLKTSGSKEFGFRSAYRDHVSAAPTRQVKVAVPFGFPCETNPSNVISDDRTAKLYDPDKGFGEAYVWITKDGSPLDKTSYDTGLFEHTDGWDDTEKRWKVEEGDRFTVKIAMKNNASAISDNSVYKFVTLTTGKRNGTNSPLNPHANTLSLSIPQDSINASNKCDYQLSPTVNPPYSATSSVELGTSIDVRGHVTPDGFDKDTHNWQLTAHIFDSGEKPSQSGAGSVASGPCAWKPGKSCVPIPSASGSKKFQDVKFNTGPYNFDTSGLEINDWVCFVMSVQKPTPDAGVKWAHSPLKCVKISGEVVGTTVSPSTYSYYPDLGVTAKIENEAGYPKIDTFKSKDYKRNGYEWKIIEAKFSSKPSSIGTSDKGGCNTVQNVAGFLNGTCRVISDGDNLFPTDADSTTKTAASNQQGPDPIGTWTCYTTSYLKNPKPLDSLKNDISTFAGDWNDYNSTSGNPGRWGDGYYRYWVDTSYTDEDGKYISDGYYEYVGDTVNENDIWNGYVTSSPDSTNPEYKFTPYKRSSCSVSGIDPKVQVRGHDLQVGGKIDSWIRNLTKGPVGSYGSNAEYGILSGGANARMASGSGLIRSSASSNQSSWSPLTFTNNSSTFGQFNGVLQANRPSASGADEITNISQISLAAGTKKVYHVSGTLTINSNLQYANNYSLVSDIPRVIIIADTIEIGPNVTRIDPWLVAENISTCNSVTTNYSDNPQQALGAADLTIGQCSNPLVFNGPVYVSNLYLYRTGGSRIPRDDINANASSWGFDPDASINPDTYCETGHCGGGDNGTRYAFSAPAEVFNLRPDAYLSSFSGLKTNKPVAITDKITELPPRF